MRLGGINRSTLARALQSMGDIVVARGGSRRRRYALRRPLRGNPTPIPLFRIDTAGHGREIGHLDLSYPEGCALSFQEAFRWPLSGDMADGWFDGLPYPLVDMRPQGFLGRNFAQRHALDLQVAENPERWSDDDVLHVLALRGNDLPGDLVLGEAAYRRVLDLDTTTGRVLTEEEIEAAYPRLAALALAHGEAASSAGGEFPKFTAARILSGEHVDVIVKFSGADDSPTVQRWADLLVCEHLALTTLESELGIAAARSNIRRHGNRIFLESVRFDRHGQHGRSAVCTLASVNPALLGMGNAPWPKVANALQREGWLSGQDAERIARVWWFGRLIANTDMHEGNLAFRPGLALAPVYDMLPMAYAPLRGGEVPQRTYTPERPLPGDRPAWVEAAAAAVKCWEMCAADPRISPGFRRICEANAATLAGVSAG